MEKVKVLLRPIGTHLLVAAIAGALVFFFKPDVVKTVERVQIVQVEKQVVVVQEKVRVEVVRVKDTQVAERIHKERTEEKRTDGTVIVKETEDHNIDSVVKEHENTIQVKVVEVTKEVVVERIVLKEKTVTPVLPNWHLGILAGVAPRLDSPAETPVMVGLEVERRILGPLFVGGWAMGGSPVVGTPKLVNFAAGLKIGASF